MRRFVWYFSLKSYRNLRIRQEPKELTLRRKQALEPFQEVTLLAPRTWASRGKPRLQIRISPAPQISASTENHRPTGCDLASAADIGLDKNLDFDQRHGERPRYRLRAVLRGDIAKPAAHRPTKKSSGQAAHFGVNPRSDRVFKPPEKRLTSVLKTKRKELESNENIYSCVNQFG